MRNLYVEVLPKYIIHLHGFSRCQGKLVQLLSWQKHIAVHHARSPNNRHLEPALPHIPLFDLFVSFKRPEAINQCIDNTCPQ